MIAARTDPEIAEALAYFRATDAPEHSIYPFAPVFPADVEGRRVVIKRARQSVPDVIAAWTNDLAGSGFPCVAPVSLAVANPARLESGTAWVAYPFVAGRTYRPSPSDAAAAGDLLGRLHDRALGRPPVPPLPWPEYQPGEVAADLASYLAVAHAHLAPRSADRLRGLADRFEDHLLPAVRTADVPVVDATADWKASNLVYAPDGPVLIDPDNANRIPRLLDLALAALQFHSEVLDRAFIAAEWTAFRDGYLARVRLTESERALWPIALDYQLWEEVAWAIGDDEWTDPQRPGYFTDVLAVTADRFPL